MNCLNNSILVVEEDSIDLVRKQLILDEKTLKESIDILNDWIQKQAHFKKKKFQENYLERVILTCKGSVERSKRQLEKICTYRTLVPQYFQFSIDDFDRPSDFVSMAVMPRVTEDYYRIVLGKLCHSKPTEQDCFEFFKYAIMMAEYLKRHDYVVGFLVICDFRGIDIYDIMTHTNPIKLKEMFSVIAVGYGMRVKTINIISDSKAVDLMYKLITFITPKKVHKKINILKTLDELRNDVQTKLLPKDYGGEEKSFQELTNDWYQVLYSKDHLDYLAEASTACTDESLRVNKQYFDEEYAGMDGTFRTLNID